MTKYKLASIKILGLKDDLQAKEENDERKATEMESRQKKGQLEEMHGFWNLTNLYSIDIQIIAI